MATKKWVQVSLGPNEALAAQPDPTWPRPAGVTVRFTGAGGDAPQGTTEAEGLFQTDLQDGADYGVEVIGDDWALWEPAEPMLTVPAAKAGAKKAGARASEPIHVTLVPRDDLWLIALRLSQRRSGGRPVAGAVVGVARRGGPHGREFSSGDDGYVYAVAARGDVTLRFDPCEPPGQGRLLPQDEIVDYTVRQTGEVDVVDAIYLRAIELSVKPTVERPDGTWAALTGASVTVAYRGSEQAGAFTETRELAKGDETVPFEFRFPGTYQVTVEPPPAFEGWPVVAETEPLPSWFLGPGGVKRESARFQTVAKERVKVDVQTPQGMALDAELRLQFYGDEGVLIPQTADAHPGPFEADVPADTALKIRLDPDAGAPEIGGIPLELATPDQDLVRGTDTNTIVLQYQHAIIGHAVDEDGNPVPDALVDVFDERQNLVARVVADATGSFIAGLIAGGPHFVAVHTQDGEPVTRTPVNVRSVLVIPQGLVVRSRRGPTGPGAASRGFPREAFTDLASYPVLTEEVATTGGFPAPAGGAGPGAGYAQTVDQVIRDVLGWRPGADVSAFQAALAGAFQLREVAGHTEWTWQQRGYSVQADMGALTGAQASIYARAKNALDQIQPLIAGVTSLNPALSTPEEREAIRTVVTGEVTELVSELSFEGGPRIQRVDELFTLLTGERTDAVDPNPDHVTGHLGTMRQRFALTVDQVDTIDDERVLTNFRVIVEQVLALQTSWQTDRGLLSGVGPETSLGTILIRLARGLEAVGDSVDELTFTLDSVFIDAAQRQVLELRLAGMTVDLPDLPLMPGVTSPFPFDPDEPVLLLSDLLDWVTRATRDEGPRMIQDAGKDGVLAFAPVLNRLRQLIHGVRKVARRDGTLPPGMWTPRVRRALDVLAGQLDDAASLTRLVQQVGGPAIAAAWWVYDLQDALRQLETQQAVTKLAVNTQQPVWVVMVGSNFRYPATAVLSAIGRPDLPVLYEQAQVRGTSFAYAKITDLDPVLNSPGTTWQVSIMNDDGTRSTEVPALQV